MNFSLWIAKRIQLTPNGKKQRSPGVTIAIAGISVSIVVMLLTLAVVSGFQNQIRNKVIGFDSQITVSKYVQDSSDSPLFAYSDSLSEVMNRALPDGAVVSGQLSSMCLLKTTDDYVGLALVSDKQIVDDYISHYIIESSDTVLRDEKAVLISAITAKRLNLGVGDKVFAHFFVKGNVKTRRFTVGAIYDTSFGERDKRIAFCSSEILRSVLDAEENQVMNLEITGCNFSDISEVSGNLQESLVQNFYAGNLDEIYQVNNVLATGAAYFGWLDLLDTNVVVIIILMSLVAAFTLISSLFILILERVRMIGVLKSLGAENGAISKIFIFLAMKIVGLGLLIGNTAGLVLIWLQSEFHLLPLNPEAYYLSYVPVEFHLSSWALLNVGAIIVAWLVLILPSMIVSKISPASTIRYE